MSIIFYTSHDSCLTPLTVLQMSVGLFEMCNPHLLPLETLSEQIKTRLCLPVFNSSRTNLGML